LPIEPRRHRPALLFSEESEAAAASVSSRWPRALMPMITIESPISLCGDIDLICRCFDDEFIAMITAISHDAACRYGPHGQRAQPTRFAEAALMD